MAKLQTLIFRCLDDNTGMLIRDVATGACAAVDVPDADAVLAAARAKGWTITDVLVTHEHADHVQGVAALKAATGAKVQGPREATGLAPIDTMLGEGSTASFGALSFDVWHTPGHCPGHLSYVARDAALALVADVVFVMGCGRIISGNAEQLWASISRIMALPGETMLVSGHDYTLSNARFALAMEPQNAELKARFGEAERSKAAGEFWSTTTVAEEHATNPYFRAAEPSLAAAVGLVGADPGRVFAALREAKNKF
ncbi:MAG: hydroxyacylglutathione hydrolase [Bosea sp. (in: a-proteobacteria)]